MRFYFFVSLIILFNYIQSISIYNIGVQVPLTGKFASEGIAIYNSIRLLVDQNNQSGGINGIKFKVVSCDDEGDPQKALFCAKYLIGEGVKAVIGSYSSSATRASQSSYMKQSILQTSCATETDLVNSKNYTFFRNAFNSEVEGKYTARYLVSIKKYKRIVILGDYSSFSQDLSNSVNTNILQLKGNVIFQGKINSGDNDFKAILTKIKSLNPDAIYFSGYYIEGGLIRSQEVQLGIKVDFIGGNSNDNPQFIKIAGSSAIGSYLIGLPTQAQLNSKKAISFIKDYKSKYNSDIPSVWTFTNSDGLLTLFEAIAKTKSIDNQVLIKYIHTKIKDLQVLTGTITLDSNGERLGSLYQVVKIDNNFKYKKV